MYNWLTAMFKKILPFLIIYLVVIILYYPVLSTYFSNDDFFHFKVSITDGSLGSFIKLFGFYPFDSRGIAFYRPLFREVLYNAFYHLFGLSAFPFRILQFLIHFINIYLVFKFVQKIYKNKIVSFFSSLFFGICTANVASFYYLAGGIQAQGATMFILLTLLLFDNFRILSFITFLAAISSHEQAALTPVLLAGLILLKYKFKNAVKKIIGLWPYFAVVSIYIFLNIKIIGYSSGETQYRLIFNPKTTINTLAWYGGWALGAPETLIDFVNPGLKLNPVLMRYWGNYYKIIFPAIFISIASLASFLLLFIIRSGKIFIDKRFWFFAVWFPLILLPVLFLPQHKSTYYLYPALPAFWTLVTVISYNGFVLINKKHPMIAKITLSILFVSLLALSSTSAILGRNTYWAATRGKLAEKIIKVVKLKFPTLPKGSGIYFTNDPTYPYVAKDWKGSSKQAYFALNGEDALQLVYRDNSLRVFYEDMDGIPGHFSKTKINSLVAPY